MSKTLMIGSERNLAICGGNMKMVKIKRGAKTIYKMVPDDWKQEVTSFDLTGDLTTGERKCIGFSDIPQEKWDKIFKKGEKDVNKQ